MSDDLALQLNVALRLLIAAAFGALVGIEREIHGHSAGFRTHTLVAVGSAMFTVLSIYGFPSSPANPVDPTRIAAQIVTGIGFLGAGAILKAGPTVHGLTTAASLWSVAAIGMAAGAGAWIVAGVGTGIVVFTLWPLNLIAKWLDRQARRPGHTTDGD
ncbi:MAG TPA: MgtC/SapB family protein [Candidatus Limnocylindrales bacterium]|jgi:putative Mg2+ transporter-C (MgtC) family protein